VFFPEGRDVRRRSSSSVQGQGRRRRVVKPPVEVWMALKGRGWPVSAGRCFGEMAAGSTRRGRNANRTLPRVRLGCAAFVAADKRTVRVFGVLGGDGICREVRAEL